jgi:hypothetical protein
LKRLRFALKKFEKNMCYTKNVQDKQAFAKVNKFYY